MSTSDHETMETLNDASRYLEGLINHERRPGFTYTRLDLRPIRALLERLGRPEEDLSMIHVAGSKGKGSTCLFAEAILLELGESVGTFTSPHLESWVERFRIDGQPVSSSALVAAVRRVRPIIEDLKQGPLETLPSFFDATTAVAFLLFAEAGVDRALIEVGLGGRLDSTNVICPAVTCVTSIELEHTDKLGDTETKIAFEKAGILKPNVPVVLGKLREAAAEVVRARAEVVGAPIIACGEHFTVQAKRASGGGSDLVFSASRPSGIGFDVSATLRMLGEAATDNAGLAIACVRALGVHSDEALCKASTHGLARCVLPARIEVLETDERVIIDAAHTAESARVLAEVLDVLAPNGIELLFSVSSDKNLSALLDQLLPRTRRVWVTRVEPSRSIDVDVLAESIRSHTPGMSIEIVEDPEAASLRARASLEADRMLCVAGSIYLAGAVRRILGGRESKRDPYPIGVARAEETLLLPDIERRAAALFSSSDLSAELADDPTEASVYQKA
jgi:dihydrofolate synthase/folylpolyglutamate synthase